MYSLLEIHRESTDAQAALSGVRHLQVALRPSARLQASATRGEREGQEDVQGQKECKEA